MEQLREFHITIYMDTNKRTAERKYDLDDIDTVITILKDCKKYGVLAGFG